MKSLKWMFCTLAISAGAYFAIGSSNPIISDNYEALSSGDSNVTFEEHDAYAVAGWSDMPYWIKYYSGFCDWYDHTYPVEPMTCIDIVVRP